MRAFEIITIAAIIFTANGAPIESTDYQDDILFIIKLLCPGTKVVYLNEDGSEGTFPANEDMGDFELNEISKQAVRDTYCPELSDNKNNELVNQPMIPYESISTTSPPILNSTITSATVTSTTASYYEDNLECVIKFLCPNIHIIQSSGHVSEDSSSFNQIEISFELQEMLRQRFQEPFNCPQLLSNNQDNGTMVIEYSAPLPEDTTTNNSSTSNTIIQNYENHILFIIKLLCPSTKIKYLSDDGSENTVPNEVNIELDDNLPKEIQDLCCPESLSVIIESVLKADKYLTTTPSESSIVASTETIDPSITITNSEIYTSTISSLTVANNKNDVSIIIKLLCPEIQIIYLNSDGSESTNHTELDDTLKQKLQELHCPESSFDNTAIANTTLAPTVTDISTSTTTEVPSITSTTIDPSTDSTIVTKFNNELLLKLLCSNIHILRSSINESGGYKPFNQIELDSQLKEEHEKFNCSQLSSYYNENNIKYESATSTSTTVEPTTTSMTFDLKTTSTIFDPTTTSTTVEPDTNSMTFDPTTTSTTVEPTSASTIVDTTATSTAVDSITITSTTSTTTEPNFRGLMLMIKLICPNTKIIYINNDDLEFSKEINEMDLTSEINDELKQKIQKSHCPKLSYENEINMDDFSTTTSTESTTTTSSTIVVPTATITTTTSPTIDTITVSMTVGPTIDTTTIPIVSSPATPVVPCCAESFESFLSKVLGKAKDFINDKMQSVIKCVKN